MTKSVSVQKYLALFVLSVLLVGPASASTKYLTIGELREEVNEGWHETYEAYGRTIAIDVEVDVPQTDFFPVLRIKKAAAVPETLLKGYESSVNSDNYLVISKTPPNPLKHTNASAWFKESYTLEPDEISWDDHLAEGSPLTAKEAMELLLRELSQFFVPENIDTLELNSLWVRSRLYAYDRKAKTFGDPLNAMGSYEFDFFQELEGIPVLVDGQRSFSPQIQGEKIPPATRVNANIFADGFFDIDAHLVEVVDTAQPDVPLLCFEEVKGEYEKLIKAGLLRDVFSVRLGYILSVDPVDKEMYWATPAWVLRGVVYDDAKQEAPPATEDTQDTRPVRNKIVDGQRGIPIGDNNASITRRQVPAWLTWDQIK